MFLPVLRLCFPYMYCKRRPRLPDADAAYDTQPKYPDRFCCTELTFAMAFSILVNFA